MTRYLHFSSRPEAPQVPERAINFLAGGTGPLGVYCYQDDAAVKAYAADRPYVFELEPTYPVLHTRRYSAQQLAHDLEQIAEVPGVAKAVRLWDKYKHEYRANNLPFAKLWYVVCHVEREPDPETPIAYGAGGGCADPAFARALLLELGHEIIDDRSAIMYASEPEQAVFLTDDSFIAKQVTMKNPRSSFKEEIERYRKEQGRRYGELKRAFASSPAVIVTDSRGKETLLIKSGETRIGGKALRVSQFLPDGPLGHHEYDTNEEILKELAGDPFASVRPADDAEVIAWTTTPLFQLGAAAAAMIQAENEIRWYSRSQPWEAMQPVYTRAREIASPGTVEAYEEAAAFLQGVLRQMPRENPCRFSPSDFAPNPAWVTRTIAKAYDTISERVPPKWMPKLSHARQKHGSFVAQLKEYGCGAYGCVLPTLDDHTVLKVTTDTTEAEFARDLAATLVVPIVVDYRLVIQTRLLHKKHQVFLLWRESAEEVGKLPRHSVLLVDKQHKKAQAAYKEMHKKGTVQPGAITAWRESLMSMAADPNLTYVANGMLRVFEEQGIFFGDVHPGNLGKCLRDNQMKWVIIDPGHISVVK